MAPAEKDEIKLHRAAAQEKRVQQGTLARLIPDLRAELAQCLEAVKQRALALATTLKDGVASFRQNFAERQAENERQLEAARKIEQLSAAKQARALADQKRVRVAALRLQGNDLDLDLGQNGRRGRDKGLGR